MFSEFKGSHRPSMDIRVDPNRMVVETLSERKRLSGKHLAVTCRETPLRLEMGEQVLDIYPDPLVTEPPAGSTRVSARSNTALATSDASARVGRGDVIMLSNICVAMTTGLPAARAMRVMRFCSPGTRSTGISTPCFPRAPT